MKNIKLSKPSTFNSILREYGQSWLEQNKEFEDLEIEIQTGESILKDPVCKKILNARKKVLNNCLVKFCCFDLLGMETEKREYSVFVKKVMDNLAFILKERIKCIRLQNAFE
jgi:hypothetical protein